MDGYQSIVDMQLLAIEKTLLAADQHFQTDHSREIVDIVTNFGMNIQSLLSKMQKASKRSLLSHVYHNKIRQNSKSASLSNKSFSQGISTRSTRASLDKQMQDYALTKLCHSLTSVSREKKREYFDQWRSHWLLSSSKTDRSPRVRFEDEHRQGFLARKSSFMDAEPSSRQNTVHRLIAKHNGTSQDDLSHPSGQQSSNVRTTTSSSLNSFPEDDPDEYGEDVDAHQYPFSPSPDEAEDEGASLSGDEGRDSAYSPALFSAHDGAPLMLESIEDMYIGQSAPNTYATITTLGSLSDMPEAEEEDSRGIAVDNPEQASLHLFSVPAAANNANTSTDTRQSASAAPPIASASAVSASDSGRRGRYALPFSMDSMDDLYSQIVEMDSRGSHINASRPSRGHVPMSPSRSLLTSMMSSLMPPQGDYLGGSEAGVDAAVQQPSATATTTHSMPKSAMRYAVDGASSSEPARFTNFPPGGQLDGMAEAFELSP